MLTAFQPPRGHKNRHLGIQSNLSPASPDWPAGAFPRAGTTVLSAFSPFPKAGAERAALLRCNSGRTVRAFQRRKPFVVFCRGPSSPQCSILDRRSCVLPVSGRVSCQRMFRAASVLWFPLRHAAFFSPPALCSRSVPSGQAMPLVLPLFRRRVSHAGRDGRLDERRAKTGYFADAMIIHRIKIDAC